jgi:hypothetical protein
MIWSYTEKDPKDTTRKLLEQSSKDTKSTYKMSNFSTYQYKHAKKERKKTVLIMITSKKNTGIHLNKALKDH